MTPPEEKRGPNLIFDHFMNYSGFAETEFSYITAEDENQKRKTRNFLLYSLGRSLVYYVAILPL